MKSMSSIYPHQRSMSTKYWERLQKIMDAARTQASSSELRRKWLDNQKKNNYRNEYDRLMGVMSHLAPNLQKAAVQQMMDKEKLQTLGVYEEPKPEPEPAPATPAPEPTRRRRATRAEAQAKAHAKALAKLAKAVERANKQKTQSSGARGSSG